MWVDWQVVIGVPNDLPIVGYGGETVNCLRLFTARAPQDFDMAMFNTGDFQRAVEQKVRAETISKVLYPSDAIAEGKELRLIQEYFLVACAVRDLVRRFEATGRPIEEFAEAVGVQLNDTHPAMAVAELMRLLIDEKELEWTTAWEITKATCAYTNHTLLPEALERWPVSLFERVLPRHLQVIYEINTDFWNRSRIAGPATLTFHSGFPSLKKVLRNRFGCAIWPSSEATRSTAFRQCTRNWSRIRSCRNSTNCGRNALIIRRMVLLPGAGLCSRIRT